MSKLGQGLRRGEALVLPVNAIHEGIDPRTGALRLWMNVDELGTEEDSRYLKPSLKTPLSRRQIPVARDVVTAVEHYADNFRGRLDSPFLFVSNRGKPLAPNTVNYMFKVLSEELPQAARDALTIRMHSEAVTPHDLRHTCAVFRLSELIEGGTEMKLALQQLRAFLGWSRSSDMPQHYARAYFEDRLHVNWRNKLGDRVDLLRHLRRIERHGGVSTP